MISQRRASAVIGDQSQFNPSEQQFGDNGEEEEDEDAIPDDEFFASSSSESHSGNSGSSSNIGSSSHMGSGYGSGSGYINRGQVDSYTYPARRVSNNGISYSSGSLFPGATSTSTSTGGPVMRHSMSMPAAGASAVYGNHHYNTSAASPAPNSYGYLRSNSMGQAPMTSTSGGGIGSSSATTARSEDIDSELFLAFHAHCSNQVFIHYCIYTF